MKNDLATLIEQHTQYCINEYQQYKLPHLTSEKTLDFQERMCQSLTHFAMWLRSSPDENLPQEEPGIMEHGEGMEAWENP